MSGKGKKEGDRVYVDAAALRARVDELRRAKEWSWREVAAKAGIVERTPERWKKNENVPSRESVERVAEIFGLTLDELVAGLPYRAGHSSAPPSSERLAEFDARARAVGTSFVGRRDELERLQEAIADGHSTNVIGDPLIGKSSLLLELVRRAREDRQDVVFVDGRSVHSDSPASLVEAITESAPGAEPSVAADALVAWVKARLRRGRPLIVIDDFDKLAVHLPASFFDRLHGIAGSHQACFVLATRTHISELRASPEGTISTSAASLVALFWPLPLPLLDLDAAEALIERAEGWTCLDGPELLRRWAGRHPFFIHLLGHHLTRAQRLNKPSAGAVEDFYLEAQPFLEKLWRRLGHAEQAYLLEEEISFPHRPSARLIRRGLLTEDKAHFGGVLTRWLSEMTR
ncbi:MAG: XRE family transcriptional regulator [Byssovorax sp.]